MGSLAWWRLWLRKLNGFRQRPAPLLPTEDPDEKRQSMVLKHLLSWQRVVMSETIPHFLRAVLRLSNFCMEEYVGRRP